MPLVTSVFLAEASKSGCRHPEGPARALRKRLFRPRRPFRRGCGRCREKTPCQKGTQPQAPLKLLHVIALATFSSAISAVSVGGGSPASLRLIISSERKASRISRRISSSSVTHQKTSFGSNWLRFRRFSASFSASWAFSASSTRKVMSPATSSLPPTVRPALKILASPSVKPGCGAQNEPDRTDA